MSDSIFQADPPVIETPVVNTQPTIPQELGEFVGEGKKYKSVEDALKSVPHAQKHISTLEEELAKAKQELEKRKTAEELLEEIRTSGIPTAPTNEAPKGIDADSVAKVVQDQLAIVAAQATKQQNTKQVIDAFKAKFGEKAEEMYIKIAEESGLPITSLNQLAASSPNAVFKLAGIDGKQSGGIKTTSSVNLEALTPNKQELSAKVPKGATTKDLTAAWRIAGEKVKQQLGN